MNRLPDTPGQDRVEHWLHAKFQSAGREYLQQLPPSFRVAARGMSRAEAIAFFPVPLRWAVAILVLLAVGLWWNSRSHSEVVAQRTLPVQPAGPVRQPLAVQATGTPTATNTHTPRRPAPPIATNQSNQPTAISGSVEFPNVPVFASATSRLPEWRRAGNQPSNPPVRIVSGGGVGRGPGILPPAGDAKTSGGGGGSAGSTPTGGVMPLDRTPAAIIQSTENGLALWATDLSPNTEYTVWVQRRGALTPTQVGLDVSDARGALAMNLPATVLPVPVSDIVVSPVGLTGSALAVTDMGVVMSGPSGVGNLVLDVATVFVLDETTGDIVVQAKLP